MYCSSADFSGWFRPMGESRKMFDIMSTKSVLGGGVLQGCAPAFRSSGMVMLCVMLFYDISMFQIVLNYSSSGTV